jgi:SNF2 family DNA or RNA helicase
VSALVVPVAKMAQNGNSLREYQVEGFRWLVYTYLHGNNAILAGMPRPPRCAL